MLHKIFSFNSLLDEVGCMVIGDFQMDQHHLMLKDLHARPYMVTKRCSVWNKIFLLGPILWKKGHFMLHFTTLHNVSIYVKFPLKLVMTMKSLLKKFITGRFYQCQQQDLHQNHRLDSNQGLFHIVIWFFNFWFRGPQIKDITRAIAKDIVSTLFVNF